VRSRGGELIVTINPKQLSAAQPFGGGRRCACGRWGWWIGRSSIGGASIGGPSIGGAWFGRRGAKRGGGLIAARATAARLVLSLAAWLPPERRSEVALSADARQTPSNCLPGGSSAVVGRASGGGASGIRGAGGAVGLSLGGRVAGGLVTGPAPSLLSAARSRWRFRQMYTKPLATVCRAIVCGRRA
jgi:hypothetical protein